MRDETEKALEQFDEFLTSRVKAALLKDAEFLAEVAALTRTTKTTTTLNSVADACEKLKVKRTQLHHYEQMGFLTRCPNSKRPRFTDDEIELCKLRLAGKAAPAKPLIK